MGFAAHNYNLDLHLITEKGSRDNLITQYKKGLEILQDVLLLGVLFCGEAIRCGSTWMTICSLYKNKAKDHEKVSAWPQSADQYLIDRPKNWNRWSAVGMKALTLSENIFGQALSGSLWIQERYRVFSIRMPYFIHYQCPWLCVWF